MKPNKQQNQNQAGKWTAAREFSDGWLERWDDDQQENIALAFARLQIELKEYLEGRRNGDGGTVRVHHGDGDYDESLSFNPEFFNHEENLFSNDI